VEVCPGFELIAIEDAAALGHDVLELSKRPEVLVRERLIQDRPEVLDRIVMTTLDCWFVLRPERV